MKKQEYVPSRSASSTLVKGARARVLLAIMAVVSNDAEASLSSSDCRKASCISDPSDSESECAVGVSRLGGFHSSSSELSWPYSVDFQFSNGSTLQKTCVRVAQSRTMAKCNDLFGKGGGTYFIDIKSLNFLLASSSSCMAAAVEGVWGELLSISKALVLSRERKREDWLVFAQGQ